MSSTYLFSQGIAGSQMILGSSGISGLVPSTSASNVSKDEPGSSQVSKTLVKNSYLYCFIISI